MAWKGYLAPLITRVVGGGSTPRYSDPDPTGSAHLLAQRDSDPTGSAHLLKQEIAEPTGSAAVLVQSSHFGYGNVFSDNFETGDFSRWSAVTGSPVVNNSAEYTGEYGMSVVGANQYVERYLPAYTGDDLYVRFYFWKHDLVVADDWEMITLAQLWNGTGGETVTVIGHQGDDEVYEIAGGPGWSPAAAADDTWHRVEVGILHSQDLCVVKLNGTTINSASISSWGTDHYTSLIVGAMNNNGSYVSGTLYIDDVAVSTSGWIGDKVEPGDISGSATLVVSQYSEKTGSAHLLAQRNEDPSGAAHLLAQLADDSEGSAHLLTSTTSSPEGSAHLLAQLVESRDGAAHLLSQLSDDSEGAAHLLASLTDDIEGSAHLQSPTVSDITGAAHLFASLSSDKDGSATLQTARSSDKTGAARLTVPREEQTTQQYGMHTALSQWGTEYHDARMAIAAELGFSAARINFNWKTIEASNESFTWNTYHDQAVAEYDAVGMDIVGVLLGSPQWASGDSDEWVVPGDGLDSTYLAWEAHFIDFVEHVVDRFKGSVHRWEVWNEWNDVYFWKPGPDLTQYLHLYESTRDAIHAIDPAAMVAIGGFTPTTGVGGLWMYDWMPDMYDAGVYPDFIAIHPYCNTKPPDQHDDWDANFDDIDQCRDIQVAEGGAAVVPIWVTEWGWSTNQITEANQAQYIFDSLEILHDTYTFVELAILFCDVDGGGGEEYGVYHASGYGGTKKPAADEWIAFNGTVRDYRVFQYAGSSTLARTETSDKTGSAHLLASLSSDKDGSAHLLEAGSTPRTSDPDPTGSAHLLAQCTSDKDGAAHLLSNNVDDIDGAAYANWMWADYPADEEVVTGTQCNMVAKFGASLPAGQVGYWVENVATYAWYAVGYEYHAAGETEVTLNDELSTIGGYLTVDGGSGSAPLPVGRYRLRWYWRPNTEVWVWPLNIFDYSYGDTYFTLISPDSDYDGSATLAATQYEDVTGSAALVAQLDEDVTGSAHLAGTEDSDVTGSAALLDSYESDVSGSAHLMLQESDDVTGAAWLWFIITLTEPTSPTVWLSTDETRTVSWTIPQAKSTGDFQLYAIHSTSYVWWHLGSTNAVPGQTNYTKTDCNLIPSGSYSWIAISYRPNTGVWGDWEALNVIDATLEVAHVFTGSAALLGSYEADATGAAALKSERTLDRDGAAFLIRKPYTSVTGAAVLVRRKNKVTRALQRFVINTTKESGIMKQDIVPTTIDKLNVKQGGVASVSKDD